MPPKQFFRALEDYVRQIQDAHRRRQRHDHLRAILIEFLREDFGIFAEEIRDRTQAKVHEH